MSKKNILLVSVTQRTVEFIKYSKSRSGRLLYKADIVRFLENSEELKIPSQAGKVVVTLPDEWVSRAFFPFHSRKKKYVRPFLLRKLTQLTNKDAELSEYCWYGFAERESGKKGLDVYYLQERKGLEVIKLLERHNLKIEVIATPGLLFQVKLGEYFRQNRASNAALLVHWGKSAYLATFYDETFAFSRELNFIDSSEPKEIVDALTFEISQSFIYFTQRYKCEIDLVTVLDVSRTENLQNTLESQLDKKIAMIAPRTDPALTSPEINSETSQPLWSLWDFEDIQSLQNAPNLLPDRVKRTICAGCFERAGIMVGSALVTIFLIQILLLQYQTRNLTELVKNEMSNSTSGTVALFEKWQSAADSLIAKGNLPSVAKLMMELEEACGPVLELNDLELDLYSDKTFLVSGRIKTTNFDLFKQTMETLFFRLRSALPQHVEVDWDKVTFRRDTDAKEGILYLFDIRTEI